METKKCTKCGKELLIENFNMRKINGIIKPFSYCKKCEQSYNNSRYEHTCIKCGKVYRSGRKNSEVCKECHTEKMSNIGREVFKKLNPKKIGSKNHMYGVHRCGKENPNYNPNKTDEEREKGRIIEGYREWILEVYKRDSFICKCCGYDKGKILNAHHLDGYNWCKDKRIDINNGITLCNKCHNKFHEIYGFGNNTKEQFNKFKSNKEYL